MPYSRAGAAAQCLGIDLRIAQIAIGDVGDGYGVAVCEVAGQRTPAVEFRLMRVSRHDDYAQLTPQYSSRQPPVNVRPNSLPAPRSPGQPLNP